MGRGQPPKTNPRRLEAVLDDSNGIDFWACSDCGWTKIPGNRHHLAKPTEDVIARFAQHNCTVHKNRWRHRITLPTFTRAASEEKLKPAMRKPREESNHAKFRTIQETIRRGQQ